MRFPIKSCENEPVAERKRAYARFSRDPGFAPFLVDSLATEPRLQVIATWFLKHHLEAGGTLDATLSHELYSSAVQLKHWEAILHVLQCVPFLNVPEPSRVAAESFMRDALEHENRFVRAWAYSGFSQLADTFPQYREEADRLLHAALESEAPSVTARISKTLKGQN